jgi:hypothetical protein
MQCFGGDGKASKRTSLIVGFWDALLVDKGNGGVRALYLREGHEFRSCQLMHRR